MAGNPSQMSLWLGEKQYYFGKSKQTLAHTLINEIIYDCINHNADTLAVHAAAFSVGTRGILIPGKSGSGKSSLAAWLALHGYNYLTDELVLISPDGRVSPFTRPISLKPPSFAALQHHISLSNKDFLDSPRGAMIAHRGLNPNWKPATPKVDFLIFPRFIKDHPTTLTRLSAAVSCMKLLECHVNARSKPNHGFSEIAELARNAAAYEFIFGEFSGILPALQPILNEKS